MSGQGMSDGVITETTIDSDACDLGQREERINAVQCDKHIVPSLTYDDGVGTDVAIDGQDTVEQTSVKCVATLQDFDTGAEQFSSHDTFPPVRPALR